MPRARRAADRVIVAAAVQQPTRPLFTLCWCCALLLALTGCGSEAGSATMLKPRELKTNVARLSLVSISPDGSRIAAGGIGGEILVWSDVTVPPQALDSGRKSPLVSLTWSPDGLLVATDLDGGLVAWQFGRAQPERVELPGLPTTAVCVAFRPNTSALELVLGLRDGSLMFLDARGTKQLKPDHRGPVKQVAYSPDGSWLVSGGADGQLIWRSAATRSITEATKAHESEVSRVLWEPTGQRLITGDWNGRIHVWDTATRKSVAKLQQPDAVSGLVWFGSHLLSGSWSGELRVWNLSSRAVLRTVTTEGPVHDLALNAKTKQAVSVGLGRTVWLWDFTDSP